ncbi:hypothetical protein [Hymenobacter psoromatis]|uniref:hypothetical protein n=1 Tax=Hymenobacter psoromatis TaxID=1484116 RepID=UPI001CBCCED9|nr:hypothetical protein [Hymenobacter psoromatis]
MELLVHLCYWFSSHPFLLATLATPAIPLTFLLFKNAPRWVYRLLFLLLGLGVLNLFFGPGLASRLVYGAGIVGTGEVVSTYATTTQVNYRNVMGYRVLLHTAQGQTLETTFNDMSFPAYPNRWSSTYPGQGEKFGTRYLPDYPRDFVVLTNDDSPWAHGRQCAALLDSLHEARTRHESNLSDAAARQTYVGLLRRVLARGCYTDSTDLREYDGDLGHLRVEPCQALLDSLDAARRRCNADLRNQANNRAYSALIRRVIARPACYTDTADLRQYYADLAHAQRVQAENHARQTGQEP